MPRITFWSCLPHNGGRFVLRQSNPYYKKVPPPFLCIFQPKMHLGDKHNSHFSKISHCAKGTFFLFEQFSEFWC